MRALPGAVELLATLTEQRRPVGDRHQRRRALRPARRSTCSGCGPDTPLVTRDQVRYAKPDPDLFLTAAERIGVDIRDSIVVGDSVWDLLAARRARALGIGLLSGGYGREELIYAGAFRVYEDPGDLLAHLDEVGVRRGDLLVKVCATLPIWSGDELHSHVSRRLGGPARSRARRRLRGRAMKSNIPAA